MTTPEEKTSKMKFALIEGGVLGIRRGFVLSEIYTFLFTIVFVGLIAVDGDSSYDPIGFALVALFIGQLFGVLPSIVIGFISGTAIAGFTIMLSDRDPAVAGRLAATVALVSMLAIDAAVIVFSGFPFLFTYAFYFGVPGLIFIIDAVRTTRSQVPKASKAFPPGNLKTQTVRRLFWIALTVRALGLIAVGLGPLVPFFW